MWHVTLHSLPSCTATELVVCSAGEQGGYSHNVCRKESNRAELPMVKKTDGTYCRTSSNAPAKVTAKLKERKEREKREVEFI